MKIEKIKQYAEAIIKAVDLYGLKDIKVHELLGLRARYDGNISAIQELTELASFSQAVINEIDSGFASNSLTEEDLKEVRSNGIQHSIGRKIIIIDKDSYKAGFHYGTGSLGPAQTMFDYIMIAEKYPLKDVAKMAEYGIKYAEKVRKKYGHIVDYKPMESSLAIHKAYFFAIGAFYVDLRDMKKAISFIRTDVNVTSPIHKRLAKDIKIVEKVLKLFAVKSVDQRAMYKLDAVVEAIEKSILKESIENTLASKGLDDEELTAVQQFYGLLEECHEGIRTDDIPFESIETARVLMCMKTIEEVNKGTLTSSKMVLDQYGTSSLLSTVGKVCMIQHFTNEKCNDVDDIYTLLPLNHMEGHIYFNGTFTDKHLVSDFEAFRFVIGRDRIKEINNLYSKLREEK